MGQDQTGEAEDAFRREAAALEHALSGVGPEQSDDELQRRLDRLGDLFLAMTGLSPAETSPGPDLPPPIGAR